MKKLIIKYIITGFIAAGITLLVTEKETSPQTKVFVSDSSAQIKNCIEVWSKYGYKVKSLTPQSVSIAIGSIGASREVKGDVILVMEK